MRSLATAFVLSLTMVSCAHKPSQVPAGSDQAAMPATTTESAGSSGSDQRQPAATANHYCDTDKIKIENCKNIPENRRNELGRKVTGGNPVAVALDKGNLFVYYTVGGDDLQKCQITSNVDSFKLSQNPGDVATAYFVKADELHDLRMEGAVAKGECPKKKVVNMNDHSGIGGSLKEYAMISNANAKYVGIARMTTGILLWTDSKYQKVDSASEAYYETMKKQLQ